MRGTPSISITVRELASRAYFGPHDLGTMDDVRLSSRRNYDCPETYSNGCVAAELEVDVDTGIVSIERLVVVEDCGPLINPLVVEGQVFGAVAQGIGMTLYEEVEYSPEGQPQDATLMDFLYPSASDIPNIESSHIETPSPRTYNGSRGVAEGGTIGAPAAIVNAIADALQPFGITIDRTPVTPQYLRSLCEDGRPR